MDEEGTSLQEYLKSHGLLFAEESRVDSFELIEMFVALNYGVGILPMRLIGKDNSKIKRLLISATQKRFGKHGIYISFRDDSHLKKITLDKILKAAEDALLGFSD